jgi:hypothetical protein
MYICVSGPPGTTHRGNTHKREQLEVIKLKTADSWTVIQYGGAAVYALPVHREEHHCAKEGRSNVFFVINPGKAADRYRLSELSEVIRLYARTDGHIKN